MIDETIEEAKGALRRKAHAARAAMSQGARAEAAIAVTQYFFDTIALAPQDVVAAYWGIRDELDCQPILVRLMDRFQPVVLPVVMGPEAPLELRIWEQGAALYPSGFGTLAPSELAPQAEPDVVLMPLLGFDKAGTRLGYGGGYYDRTLAGMSKKPRLIGLAFAAQELDAIPRQEHDIPLDAVVTEAGVRHFGASQ
jgi:5-formyltetrahydrofolate cyclo-ligase